jgi:hypothetical protein
MSTRISRVPWQALSRCSSAAPAISTTRRRGIDSDVDAVHDTAATSLYRGGTRRGERVVLLPQVLSPK